MYTAMLVICFLLVIMQLSESGDCPSKYRMFSAQHSFCLPRNPSCKIFSSGLKGKQEIDEILKIHNSLRSKIAMGLINEKGEVSTDTTHNFPKAADMMEMVWDDELSSLAQKWVERCEYKHDCVTCKSVPSYSVGQNLAYKQWSCPRADCSQGDNHHNRVWTETIKDFFNEIVDAPKNVLKSYYNTGKKIGHFTQVIWAHSWRIGCGFVSYEHEHHYRQYYACNYGPAGNVLTKPVYTQGEPCTKCPENSCCGNKCYPPALPGLCRLLPGHIAPHYLDDKKGLLLSCDFRKNGNKCPMFQKGVRKWKIMPTYSGPIMCIILNGGETSTLEFHKRFASKRNQFCLRLLYSKGPSEDGQKDSNFLQLSLSSDKYSPITQQYKSSSKKYITFDLLFPSVRNMNLKLTFSVPKGSSPQFLRIKKS